MRYLFRGPFVQYLRAFLPHRRYLKFPVTQPGENFLASIASYLVKMMQKCGIMVQLTAPKDLTGGSSSQLLLPTICLPRKCETFRGQIGKKKFPIKKFLKYLTKTSAMVYNIIIMGEIYIKKRKAKKRCYSASSFLTRISLPVSVIV